MIRLLLFLLSKIQRRKMLLSTMTQSIKQFFTQGDSPMADPTANDLVNDEVTEDTAPVDAPVEEAPVEEAVPDDVTPLPPVVAQPVPLAPPLPSFQEQLTAASQAFALALSSIDNSNAGVQTAANTVKAAEAQLAQAQTVEDEANAAMANVNSVAVAAAESLMRVLRDWLTSN